VKLTVLHQTARRHDFRDAGDFAGLSLTPRRISGYELEPYAIAA